MTTPAFSGIMPAVITTFDEQERFAAAPFEQLLERLYGTGIDGLYVTGQTGEGLLQPVEQRMRVAEVAVKNSPAGKAVIVHTGAHRTEDALALTKHAGRIGAHAVSSLPPAGSYSFAEIKAYYETLAAASDVPLLVYYFPSVAPVIQAAAQALELAAIPNVVGLKFTDFDLYKLWQLKQSGCVVFNGHDEVLIAGALMGADGGIGSFYNLVPELFVEAFAATRRGDWAHAQQVQTRINQLIQIVLRYPMLAAIKTILRWQGLAVGEALAPRRRLTEAEAESLRQELRTARFFDI